MFREWKLPQPPHEVPIVGKTSRGRNYTILFHLISFKALQNLKTVEESGIKVEFDHHHVKYKYTGLPCMAIKADIVGSMLVATVLKNIPMKISWFFYVLYIYIHIYIYIYMIILAMF